MSPEFLVTTLVIVATPGTGVLYTLATALSRGARAGVIAAVGCTLGIIPHLVAATVGLAAVLNASALAFESLKVLGVIYLLYLAWRMLRDREGLGVTAEPAPPASAGRIVGTAVVINILNPKLTLFFFAFLPQFVSPEDPDALLRMLELSGVFMLVTLGVFVGYGVLAAAVRRRVLARPRAMAWMRRAFAGAFLALGVRLALTSR